MDIVSKMHNLYEQSDTLSGKRCFNLARKKFMSLFVAGLIQSRDVQFGEVAAHMPTETKTDSNHRRIQDFFATYELDYVQMAVLLYCVLPRKGKLYLSIDRTNWSFGDTDHNILVISAYCEGVGVPLWFEMLEDGKGGGNSNQEERIKAMRYCVRLFGSSRELVLCGDREFIGDEWIGWLLKQGVEFYLRIRKNTKLLFEGKEQAAWKWVEPGLEVQMDNCRVGSHWLSVAMKKVPGKKAEEEYLIVITNTFAHQAIQTYKLRWSIEVFFQSVKGRGFNLEKTHLKDPKRLRKLFALVAIAFAICLKIGIWAHKNIKKIPIKNHGYKKNSFFRHGLDCWREALRMGTRLKIFIRIIQLCWTQKISIKLNL